MDVSTHPYVALDALDGVLVAVAADAYRQTLVRCEEATGADAGDQSSTVDASETVFVPVLRVVIVSVFPGTVNTYQWTSLPSASLCQTLKAKVAIDCQLFGAEPLNFGWPT